MVAAMRVLWALLASSILVLCGWGAAPARADGDPASDMLVIRNVFVPYEAPSGSAVAALTKQVEAVYAAGDRVKVAVVSTRIDLGSIPSLFAKPATYATFLGKELAGYYIGPLLVVMPAGYGIYDGGRSTAAEGTILAALPHPASAKPNDLVDAAATAVGKLLRAGALKSADILEPFVETIGAGVAQHRLSVRYYVFDDSGKAAVTLTVSRAGTTLYTAHFPARKTDYVKPAFSRVLLPAGVSPVGARVCVAAADAAGNVSPRSCKPLKMS
jgi:hypothetical protein